MRTAAALVLVVFSAACRVQQRQTGAAKTFGRGKASKDALVTGATVSATNTQAGAKRAAAAGETPASVFGHFENRSIWDFGIFVSGGTSVVSTPSARFLIAGVRVGRVLMADHFRGWMRGNLEMAMELIPVYETFTPQKADYAASFEPIIVRWNFTSARRVMPYAQIAAGVLYSGADLPPGNTSRINFTPQCGVGVHYFERPNRSLDFEYEMVHVSNASLGVRNPGYNFGVQFTIGFTWFKRPHAELTARQHPEYRGQQSEARAQ